jgi:hypothetical protein
LLTFWSLRREASIDRQLNSNPGHRRSVLVLFDHSVPAPLRYALKDHVVVEAVERGWEALGNGALLDAAEAAGFEVFVTADKNIRFQQNLALRKVAVVVLGNAQWPVLCRYVDRVVATLGGAPGSYAEVEIPFS